MTRIPRSALILGLAGVLPFLWGACTVLIDPLREMSQGLAGRRFTGHVLLQGYGIVILSFMSGVVWGFATRAQGRAALTFYLLSVLPALWAFFLGSSPWPPTALIALALGFAGLLGVDRMAMAQGLAPDWWMSLRVLLTLIVVVCLLIGAFL